LRRTKIEIANRVPNTGDTLNQWTKLSVFASDDAVPVDSNTSERESRRAVLNRKNSLFVGNPLGGVTEATLRSLPRTRRRHRDQPAA
jgi:hypothetical protein